MESGKPDSAIMLHLMIKQLKNNYNYYIMIYILKHQ